MPTESYPYSQLGKVVHDTVDVQGVNVFYRRCGRRDRPAVLLLHGAPSSSFTFRAVMPMLADTADVIAPDLPGFGFTEVPQDYEYTFESMSQTVERLVDALGIERYFIYLHDFGAAVGYLMAMRRPGHIRGLIVQNGSAHEEGHGPVWDAAKAYWKNPTPKTRAELGDWLNFEGTRDTYIGGIPDRLKPLFAPECWHLDWEHMSRPGNTDIQFRIFEDYQNHVARFDRISAYHAKHQPPCLLMWGRHDVFFQLDETMAYARELDDLEMHIFDGAHFLLETHAQECAALMRKFVRRVELAQPGRERR